jgi:hypothetical protein
MPVMTRHAGVTCIQDVGEGDSRSLILRGLGRPGQRRDRQLGEQGGAAEEEHRERQSQAARTQRLQRDTHMNSPCRKAVDSGTSGIIKFIV